ncbi:MAG: tetratricopeptide repeat protein [Alphaproteobacteria bacterium]
MAEDIARRLTTIVAADVAGYSRLVRADEEGTLAALRAHKAELIEPEIAAHGGRVANTAGDSLLIEFGSVVDALRCAMVIQRGMGERNAAIPEQQRVHYRIGINVGDVMAASGDLLGDGVNVAARIEALAEPGGICLSRTARDQVRDRSDVALEDMGEVAVKNIDRPVRVFRVRFDGAAPARRQPSAAGRRPIIAVGMLVAAAIIGAGAWAWLARPLPTPVTETERPVTSEAPSIAVLPFQNLSGGADQDYFAQGMTEDIITDLSKVDGLLVASRSRTQRYGSEAIDPGRIGRELNVQYVMEGSVRRAAGRLRISAQLIDAATGTQLWAERYDRSDSDIFAIQDEIADKVVSALSVRVNEGSLTREVRRYTPSPEAYDLYIRGRAKRIPPTPENLALALRLFEQAIEIDPGFAGGYDGAAYVHVLLYADTASPVPGEHLDTALRLAQKAVELDPDFGSAWGTLAEVHLRMRLYDQSLDEIRTAIKAAPNDSLMRAFYGRNLGYAGRPADGIEQIKIAQRMSPDSLPLLFFLGANQRAAGHYPAAIASLLEQRQQLGGRILPAPTLQLAAAYMQAGRGDEARATIAALLKVAPHLTLDLATRIHPYKRPEDEARFLEALAAAGLPNR